MREHIRHEMMQRIRSVIDTRVRDAFGAAMKGDTLDTIAKECNREVANIINEYLAVDSISNAPEGMLFEHTDER